MFNLTIKERLMLTISLIGISTVSHHLFETDILVFCVTVIICEVIDTFVANYRFG